MPHPDFRDRIALKLNSSYLYQGQLCQNGGDIFVGVIHKVYGSEPYWKTMDHHKLRPGSLMKYLGRARDLKITGDMEPNASIFEMIKPVSDDRITAGDNVYVLPSDRQFIFAAPSDVCG